MANDDQEPYRFPLRMKPDFSTDYTREQTVGSRIRYQMGEDVIAEGVVIDWVDEPDGGVTLTIEAEPL